MKKFIKKVIPIMVVVALLMGVSYESHAGWARVTAVLQATETKKASGYQLFQARYMYCETMSASKYPVKYKAYKKASVSSLPIVEQSVVVNVGQNYSVNLNRTSNYHQVELTGWNVNSAVKGCIGRGQIFD